MPRKVAFSCKQKKKQLQEKKQKRQGPKYLEESSDDEEDKRVRHNGAQGQAVVVEGGVAEDGATAQEINNLTDKLEVQKINYQPQKETKATVDINSFRLHFFKESDEIIKRKKKDAQRVIKSVDEKSLECKLEDVYPKQANLDFPKRPPWNYSLTKEQLDQQEHRYFQKYVDGIINQPRVQDLSFFELNLETWRQLWRVLEISDILLVIADVRYPVLHIPPSLITYITKDLHKEVVIILNKVDFVPPVLALAWKRYVEAQYPGSRVVFFSSFPRASFESEDEASNFDPSQSLYKRPFQGKHVPIGPEALYRQCKEIVKDKVDLSSWEKQLQEDHSGSESASKDDSTETADGKSEEVPDYHDHSSDTMQSEQVRYINGIVTIGCIGYPNVGKSSVLNALVKKKVVSVSPTPGHTKHLQTIFLSRTVRLCDCPGLVFPSMVSKSLQVIAGIFPVAQVREPFSVVGFLAKRVDIPHLLRLSPPDSSPKRKNKGEEGYMWSALDICDAFAIKHGFFTSKAGRPDSYRGANKILRMAVEGQICLCFKPPNYSEKIDQYMADSEREELQKVYLSHSKHLNEKSMVEEKEEDNDDDNDDENNDDDDDDDDNDDEENVISDPDKTADSAD